MSGDQPRAGSADPPPESRPIREPPPPPPAAVMGLLNYLTVTSMDEDYAYVSRQRAERGERPRGVPGRVALSVIAAFGILVATAALQTARSADVTQSGHDELVKQVLARKAQLADRREQADLLTSEVRTLESQNLDATVQGRAVRSQLDALSVTTGSDPVRGEGIRITVDDGPDRIDGRAVIYDLDLQKMLNGLWASGAEAISINGQRVNSLSAVRLAGDTITVNYQAIDPPYVITAIGNPDTLPSRFVESPGGQWWLDLQALYGVEFQIDVPEETLTLPAAERLDLRFARLPPEPEDPR